MWMVKLIGQGYDDNKYDNDNKYDDDIDNNDNNDVDTTNDYNDYRKENSTKFNYDDDDYIDNNVYVG